MDTKRISHTTEDKIPQIPRLHIPRASLSSSTSSNASTSKSSSLCRKPNGSKNVSCGGESETEGIYRSPINKTSKLPIGNSSARNERYLVHKAPKPSSLHSLSSDSSSLSTNGSNQSNYVSQEPRTMSTPDSHLNLRVIEGSRPQTKKINKNSLKFNFNKLRPTILRILRSNKHIKSRAMSSAEKVADSWEKYLKVLKHF